MTCQTCGASSGHMPACREAGSIHFSTDSVRFTTERGVLEIDNWGGVSLTGVDANDLAFWQDVIDLGARYGQAPVARLAQRSLQAIAEASAARLEVGALSIALHQISALPGPHYSTATREAVAVARRALGR